MVLSSCRGMQTAPQMEGSIRGPMNRIKNSGRLFSSHFWGPNARVIEPLALIKLWILGLGRNENWMLWFVTWISPISPVLLWSLSPHLIIGIFTHLFGNPMILYWDVRLCARPCVRHHLIWEAHSLKHIKNKGRPVLGRRDGQMTLRAQRKERLSLPGSFEPVWTMPLLVSHAASHRILPCDSFFWLSQQSCNDYIF